MGDNIRLYPDPHFTSFRGWLSIYTTRNITLESIVQPSHDSSSMITHIVYFWLKPDLDQDSINQFIEGAKSLLSIDALASGYVGVPADTEKRPIIDSSYDYSLITVFKNMEDHDIYQVHPTHDAFRELAHLWDRVQIYDSETI